MLTTIKFSQLPYINSGYTDTDIIPFVSYINPTGTTSITKIIDLKSDLLSNVKNYYLPISGGTVTGETSFTSGLTANTISATTYQNLPETPFLPLSGGTVTGATIFTDGLTANTISATTYQNLPSLTGNYLPISGGTLTGATFFQNGLSGNTIVVSNDSIINNLTIGKGNGNFSANTVVGNSSLISNTTGLQNTAFGLNTLKLNTTGGLNTAIGVSSLQNNTTAIQNTAIGVSSLHNNTTGNNNTASGKDSLKLNTTGTNNTANGTNSQLSGTTANSNTSFGVSSMQLGTIGSQNTAIGTTSLFANTTGGNNTALGFESGRFLTNKTTAATIINNSVFLGYRTSPLAISQTNQVVIGYDANGLGNNTTVLGNTSTVTTAIYGNLLLGTTSPSSSARLKIDSTTQGVLLPRMTTAQVNSIVSPEEGLTVFNTDLDTLCFYTTSWQKVTSTTM